MSKIQSLNILLSDTGKDYLAELSGVVIDNIQKKALSAQLKNRELSGDPISGTVECRRFVNATVKAYGTARAAGKGDPVKAKPVTVAIDQDKEIVEELEAKDIRLYSVDHVLERRARNHVSVMIATLDRAYFAEAYNEAVHVEVSAAAATKDILEAVIQECENTHNQFVDGVDRELMHLTLNTALYGKIRNDLDDQPGSNVDTAAESFKVWHGVKVDSCTRLPSGCELILEVYGSVAQPVHSEQYTAEKVNLSNAYAVEMFPNYGTKAVSPDLIFTIDRVTADDTTDEDTPSGT